MADFLIDYDKLLLTEIPIEIDEDIETEFHEFDEQDAFLDRTHQLETVYPGLFNERYGDLYQMLKYGITEDTHFNINKNIPFEIFMYIEDVLGLFLEEYEISEMAIQKVFDYIISHTKVIYEI